MTDLLILTVPNLNAAPAFSGSVAGSSTLPVKVDFWANEFQASGMVEAVVNVNGVCMVQVRVTPWPGASGAWSGKVIVVRKPAA